jgi:hypothetical protein
MTDEQKTCDCCGERLYFQWSDTHGVGVCITCGLPYRIYHYEKVEGGPEQRVEKPPEVALKPSGVEIAKRYWNEKRRRVFPAYFDMGILGSRGGRSYSGATAGDIEAFAEWYEANIPAAPAAEGATS